MSRERSSARARERRSRSRSRSPARRRARRDDARWRRDDDRDGTRSRGDDARRRVDDDRERRARRDGSAREWTRDRGDARGDERRREDGRGWTGRDEDARASAGPGAGPGPRRDGWGRDGWERERGRFGNDGARREDRGGERFGGHARRPDPRETATREALASRWLEKNANGTAKVSDYNAEKLRREIYVGNLVSGQIGATMLCELLNDVLKKIVPEACHAVGKLPPVLSIVMDSAQKYASLEMRSSALATAALGLDQMHVLGRPLHITRPAGYFDDPDAKRQVLNVEHVLPAPEKLQQVYDYLDARKIEESKSKDEAIERAKKMAVSVSESVAHAAAPTTAEATEYLCLENMVDVKTLLSARERKELRYDIEDECGKCGKVVRVVVPTPSDEEVERKAASRAYVYFARVGSAESAHKVMHGRKFGGRIVQARYIEASEFEAFDKK